MINYFLVASAVLATAYVSAINGKLYPVAAVIALAEAGLTAVAYILGLRERWSAQAARPALAEVQGRIADKLQMDAFRIAGSPTRVTSRFVVRGVFGMAVLLSAGAALYAMIH